MVGINVGDAPRVLVTIKPFSFIGSCDMDGADVRGNIEIRTTVANSAFWSANWGTEDDFDPSDPDGPIFPLQHTGNPPGGAQTVVGSGHQFRAASPSGVSLEGISSIYTNFAGKHCVFSGNAIRSSK